MSKEMERMKEIEARKAELRKEISGENKPDEKRMKEIKDEAAALTKEQEELRKIIDLQTELKPGSESRGAGVKESAIERRAKTFVEDNSLSIPLFRENRSILVSSGKLATPKAVYAEIGTLPETTSSIVDEVHTIDATGTGEWEFPYEKTKATAEDVVEGSEIGGTGATFDKVKIGPEEWGVLYEVSKQVKKMSPVNYTNEVQDTAFIALRDRAEKKIFDKVKASALLEKKPNVPLDAEYLRTIVIAYKTPKKVSGSPVLYLTREDLIELGKVRGTSEKKPIYSIKFEPDHINGIISEGGTESRFSITEQLTTGQQLYGNPQTIKMLMWGDYEVSTDEGGDYFKRNMIGVKGDATAGADLVFWHGMQLIGQSTLE